MVKQPKKIKRKHKKEAKNLPLPPFFFLFAVRESLYILLSIVFLLTPFVGLLPEDDEFIAVKPPDFWIKYRCTPI